MIISRYVNGEIHGCLMGGDVKYKTIQQYEEVGRTDRYQLFSYQLITKVAGVFIFSRNIYKYK